MTIDIGARVRVVKDSLAGTASQIIGVEGRVVGVGEHTAQKHDWMVKSDVHGWVYGFNTDELELLESAPPRLRITKYLVNAALTGGVVWLDQPRGLDKVVAYGWSDGVMTWSDKRNA